MAKRDEHKKPKPLHESEGRQWGRPVVIPPGAFILNELPGPYAGTKDYMKDGKSSMGGTHRPGR